MIFDDHRCGICLINEQVLYSLAFKIIERAQMYWVIFLSFSSLQLYEEQQDTQGFLLFQGSVFFSVTVLMSISTGNIPLSPSSLSLPPLPLLSLLLPPSLSLSPSHAHLPT